MRHERCTLAAMIVLALAFGPACTRRYHPMSENCATPNDDDGDGRVDEGCPCTMGCDTGVPDAGALVAPDATPDVGTSTCAPRTVAVANDIGTSAVAIAPRASGFGVAYVAVMEGQAQVHWIALDPEGLPVEDSSTRLDHTSDGVVRTDAIELVPSGDGQLAVWIDEVARAADIDAGGSPTSPREASAAPTHLIDLVADGTHPAFVYQVWTESGPGEVRYASLAPGEPTWRFARTSTTAPREASIAAPASGGAWLIWSRAGGRLVETAVVDPDGPSIDEPMSAVSGGRFPRVVPAGTDNLFLWVEETGDTSYLNAAPGGRAADPDEVVVLSRDMGDRYRFAGARAPFAAVAGPSGAVGVTWVDRRSVLRFAEVEAGRLVRTAELDGVADPEASPSIAFDGTHYAIAYTGGVARHLRVAMLCE